MKRILTAAALCAAILIVGFFFLFPVSAAPQNIVESLLDLAAPPPPNPFADTVRNRSLDFYSKKNPPSDDTAIEDLLDYWKKQSESYQRLGYNIHPSEKSLDRILSEIRKTPSIAGGYLNILPDSQEAADLIKDVYEGQPDETDADHSEKQGLKKWLTYHSSYFSADLTKDAAKAGDASDYVSNQEELLALAGVDWDQAGPMVDRLYMNGRSPSGVLAKWAHYVHALKTNDLGDVDRYRDELKAVVEDKTATPGMRDLAFDALVKEKDWSGRDEWYYSLLGDETLSNLVVNGSSYTGLTTIIRYSPPDRYADKMIELTKSSDIVVRSAAARNLLLILNKDHPEATRALLPWLENPKWAKETGNERVMVVASLRNFQMPESVPGLIAALEEKRSIQVPDDGANVYGANRAVSNAMNAASVRMAVNAAVNAANTAANKGSGKMRTMIDYPLRSGALGALEEQRDGRAIPALRRSLNELQTYERVEAVRALLYCNGFSVQEQIEALEEFLTNAARNSEIATSGEGPATYTVANTVGRSADVPFDYQYRIQADQMNRPLTPADIKELLGPQVAFNSQPSNELVDAVIKRIEAVEPKDPALASSLRKVVLRWPGSAVNSMALRDLKNGKAETEGIVRLLALRKDLREKQANEIVDARAGNATAAGIAACLFENADDSNAILSTENAEVKTALLACARLIRAPLDIHKVAAELQSKDKLLATAAEKYLESEDSPEARLIVLSLHPDEAKILGATTCSRSGAARAAFFPMMYGLFASVQGNINFPMYYYEEFSSENAFDSTEKKIKKEVLENPDLLAIYSYQDNIVRIYKDKVLYAYDDDESRFKERPLSKEEFESITGLLAKEHVEDMAPFLGCSEACEPQELLMVGRHGGRRVFFLTSSPPQFIRELEKIFAELRLSQSEQKYHLSKEVPGLEVLFADDNWEALTLWKNGNDFRVLAGAANRTQKIDRELESLQEDGEQEPNEEFVEKITKLRAKRQQDSIAWFSLDKGRLTGQANQPDQVEYLPRHDSLAVPQVGSQWKARANGVELRVDTNGLYKVTGGKLTKILEGDYGNPVLSQNGRWAVAVKYSEEDESLVRINLTTNKEFKFGQNQFSYGIPIAYLPSINKFLISMNRGDEEGEGYDENAYERDVNPGKDEMVLADAETGTFQEARGEFRPVGQQTFRPLQQTATPFESWAAIPDLEKHETIVGIYDSRTLTFKPSVKVPKIIFNSMRMWVDESEKKVYFVYRGQVLSLPIGKSSGGSAALPN